MRTLYFLIAVSIFNVLLFSVFSIIQMIKYKKLKKEAATNPSVETKKSLRNARTILIISLAAAVIHVIAFVVFYLILIPTRMP